MNDAAPTPPDTRCPHFGVCGGCRGQDVPYPAQLAAKAAELDTLFAGQLGAITVTPSPEVWHYRNKVDPVFAPMRYDTPPPKGFIRETVLGYKRLGQWFWPLDIDTCLIAPRGMDALVGAVRDWYRRTGTRAHDPRNGDGTLKVLLVREGRRTGQRMVVLITRPAPVDTDGFAAAVQQAWPAQSIQWGTTTSTADVAQADALSVLTGEPTIDEALHVPTDNGTRELHFRISPFSFFQTNTLATELLYGWLRARVAEAPPHTLYDLYGGAGGIAFACSDLVARVQSVESVAEASEDGRFNAENNEIYNVRFDTAPVEKWLQARLQTHALDAEATVVCDPPRSGMHPKALKRLLHWAPRRVLYVSCNPKLLAREWPALRERYTLEAAQAFDLFPHTPHVELAVSLVRRDASTWPRT